MTLPIPVTGSTLTAINNEEDLYDGNLRHYLRVVCQASNVSAGYHNLRHMLHVTVMCYSALLYYKGVGRSVSQREARNLMIAAMFHDYNHPGCSGPDILNITRALRGLEQNILPEDQGCYHPISNLIKWTEFPYPESWGEVPLLGQILRDADRSQAFSQVWVQQIGVGFAQERSVSLVEALRGQEKFLETLSFDTEWGRFMFQDAGQIEAKKAETRGWIQILEESE